MSGNERISVVKLTAAMRIEQVFMISQPQLRSTSRGDYYIAAFLSDKTGKINGRMWQASEAIFQSLPQEGFVWVKGRTEMYQDALQLVVDAIRPVENAEVDVAEFMPATTRDIDQMIGRLSEILAQIKNPHLRRLVKSFLEDEALMELFVSAPAAKLLHHAYIGGLLEHTLSVMELAVRILPHYPRLDGDLVLTAAFLHDIGKTTELRFEVAFDYTDEGHLIGHLVKGALLVQEKVRLLNAAPGAEPFPELLAQHLQHIIVSHHGLREFGCPVLPSSPEAYAVHHLDNLDSKIALTFNEIDKDNNPNTRWTTFVKALEAPVLKVRPGETK